MLQSIITGIYGVLKYGIVGSCPPMIIHMDQSANNTTTTQQEPSELDDFYLNPGFIVGLIDPSMGEKDFCERQNPCGFAGRGEKNGSITQERYFNYCIHFVNHLPQGFGKGRTPMVLFFDGNSSCWNLPAFCYLTNNNIYLYFLSSHTSVWTQSNGNVPNYWFHK